MRGREHEKELKRVKRSRGGLHPEGATAYPKRRNSSREKKKTGKRQTEILILVILKLENLYKKTNPCNGTGLNDKKL